PPDFNQPGKTYAEGGWIDAPPGKPVLRLVHGGEYVVSTDELAGRPRADSPFSLVGGATAAAALPSAEGAGGASTTDTFRTTGANLLGGLADGVKDKWTKTLDPYLASSKKAVQKHFDGSDEWLRPHGEDITTGLYRGVKAGYTPVDEFFTQLPQSLSAKA